MKKDAGPKSFRLSFSAICLAALAATAANAATVDNVRLDEDSGAREAVAIVTFSSITDAVNGIAKGLSGIGGDDAAETAKSVIAWMTMLPPFDFADINREASVILVAPKFGLDTPDQIAVIPLNPLNGKSILRDKLAAAYGRISGNSVLFCSEPRDEDSLPSLSLFIAGDTAFIANSRESLRWIALRWKDGNVPSAHPLRDGDIISAIFNAPLAAETVSSVIPEDIADGARDAARLLGWFRDLLGKLESLHVSFSADLNSWRIVSRLSPRKEVGQPLFKAPTPDGKTLVDIPRDAYCVSSGLFRQFASILPESLVERYSGASPYAFFGGFGILPGLAFEKPSMELEPFLAGESSSAYVISRGEAMAARIRTFALYDSKGAAAALDDIFSRDISAEQAVVRTPRTLDGRKIYGYTCAWKPTEEAADDYVASVLVLLASLNCVETAIVGDRLIIVSGPFGTIDKLISPGVLAAKSRAIDSLAPFLGTLPKDETLLGCGELQPSRTFLALMQSKPRLEGIARKLPRHGGGLSWRISRNGGDAICEISLTASELLALSLLRQFDQKQLGNFLLDDIIWKNEK